VCVVDGRAYVCVCEYAYASEDECVNEYGTSVSRRGKEWVLSE
jgi:hypothetical protein